MSKSRRFQVLRRDQFSCRYCGGKAPVVKLVVDHIIPVCKGGSDDLDNLVTACHDCNAGKSGQLMEPHELSLAGRPAKERTAMLQEKCDVVWASYLGFYEQLGDAVEKFTHDFCKSHGGSMAGLGREIVVRCPYFPEHWLLERYCEILGVDAEAIETAWQNNLEYVHPTGVKPQLPT